MKSIGADALFLSVLILLTALSNIVSRAEETETTTVQSTTSENGSTLRSSPALPTVSPSGSTTTFQAITLNPADNETKNETDTLTKVSPTTEQNHHANTSSLELTDATLTKLSSTHATQNYIVIKPSVNSTDGQNNELITADSFPDKTSTEHKDIWKDDGKDKGSEGETTPPKSKKGIFIGVGSVLAAVVFVVLIFLYKMCQKKPPAAENSEIKVRSAQTKESVKLLSVRTAAPYSDSKRMSSNQAESIEC